MIVLYFHQHSTLTTYFSQHCVSWALKLSSPEARFKHSENKDETMGSIRGEAILFINNGNEISLHILVFLTHQETLQGLT